MKGMHGEEGGLGGLERSRYSLRKIPSGISDGGVGWGGGCTSAHAWWTGTGGEYSLFERHVNTLL